jgi:hypothetical protein
MFRTPATVAQLTSVCCLLATLACSVQAPLTPAPGPGSSPKSAPDGTTLKVGAPTPVSPINSDTIPTQFVTLTISPATGQFSNASSPFVFTIEPTGSAPAD